MDGISGILSAFGLSASAGLNAYLPLLIVAQLGRFTDSIPLPKPWDTWESWWVIGALLLLGAIEFFADKIPAINHINDVVQTFVRPTAGALLFAASTGAVGEGHPTPGPLSGV